MYPSAPLKRPRWLVRNDIDLLVLSTDSESTVLMHLKISSLDEKPTAVESRLSHSCVSRDDESSFIRPQDPEGLTLSLGISAYCFPSSSYVNHVKS